MRFLILFPLLALWSCAPAPPTPPPVLEPTDTVPPIVIKKPEVMLRNFTAKNIVLGIKDPQTGKPTMYSLPARSKRRIGIDAGTYSWAATAEKTSIQKGRKTFASGQTYLWDFNLD